MSDGRRRNRGGTPREGIDAVQRCGARDCRSHCDAGAGGCEIRMCGRKARTRRRHVWKRNSRRGEGRFIKRQMERGRRLQGEPGVSITARDIAERKLRDFDAGVERRLRCVTGRRGLQAPQGCEASFVFRRQNFCAAQVIFRIDVLHSLGLLPAGAFLARSFRSILCLLSAATRRAEKQAGAEKNREPAAKRLAERDPAVHVLLRRTAEVSAIHFRPTSRNNRWPNTTESRAS